MPKPNFEAAMETRLLYQTLKQTEPGKDITYAALSRVVGYPVTGADGHLQSALHACLSRDGMVFDNIRGEGYRRLTDAQIVASSSRDAEIIRRRARRAAKKLGSVRDFSHLTGEQKIEHNARY